MRRTERNNRFRINGTLITFVDKEPATVEEAAAYRLEAVKLYCPDCVETWKERNGAEYDEQYKDAQHLFAMWWNRQVQTQIADKSKIKTYRRNCIGDVEVV